MDNDSNNNEVKDDVFVNSSSDNGFQKVNISDKKKKSVNSYYSGKPKSGFIKSVFVPFVSGIVGASLVLGICLYVPAVNEKVFNKSTSEDNKSAVINYQTGQVSNTVNLSDYSNTAISVANPYFKHSSAVSQVSLSIISLISSSERVEIFL